MQRKVPVTKLLDLDQFISPFEILKITVPFAPSWNFNTKLKPENFWVKGEESL